MTPEEYKTIRLTLGLSKASLAREVGDMVEVVAEREKGLLEIDEIAEYDMRRLLEDPPPRDVVAPRGSATPPRPRPRPQWHGPSAADTQRIVVRANTYHES